MTIHSLTIQAIATYSKSYRLPKEVKSEICSQIHSIRPSLLFNCFHIISKSEIVKVYSVNFRITGPRVLEAIDPGLIRNKHRIKTGWSWRFKIVVLNISMMK